MKKWTDVEYGVVKAATERFWIACGDDAEGIMDRINRDPEYVAEIADFARLQIIKKTVQCFTPHVIHARIRQIMGKNFFGIEEAIRHFDVKPTEEELKILENIPFAEATLEVCKDTHVLIADFGHSILNVRKHVRKAKLFYEQDWYTGEQFVRAREKAQWRLVRKTPVESSFNKTYEDQKTLLGQSDEIPSTRVVVYATISHFFSIGERLFEEYYVRTSDVVSDGLRVLIGGFGSDGLLVNRYWDAHRIDNIGLGSARKSDI